MDDASGFEAFFQRLCSATDIRTQADLARELDLGRAAVSLAKRKDQVPARWVLDLAGRYGLDAKWLETGRGSARPKAAGPGPEYSLVPKVVARLSAGGGSFETAAEVENHYSFRSDWLNARGNPRRMVLMSVVGNSMEPEIREGDLVLIDQSKIDIYSGGIYAVGVEDTVMVKRIEKLPGTLVLHSDNTDYAPVRLSGDELLSVRVIGKVLWASREYH
ncbi:MAG: S24 family peptidase [Desulfovibrionaceae bacterium]|nr:helix-turn-helix transcriptional regulator [Desulfovibrionaceae bacterium]MDD4951122.1 S24 family peptidase [Desulfovibrionaceae bacterium]